MSAMPGFFADRAAREVFHAIAAQVWAHQMLG